MEIICSNLLEGFGLDHDGSDLAQVCIMDLIILAFTDAHLNESRELQTKTTLTI